MMNRAIAQICGHGGQIVFNRHDGAVFQFPAELPEKDALALCHGVFTGPWQVWGHAFHAPSDWEVVRHGEDDQAG